MGRKKYKFMEIAPTSQDWEGKPVYSITNLRGAYQIGRLLYYRPWRQYVFEGRENAVFNASCLRDIIDFIENEIPKA
jgi:hypothetical protein